MKHTKQCYRYVDTLLTWDDAERSCQIMATEEHADNIGNLASITDNQTNVFLNSLTSKRALVGGKKDSSGKWVWSDGSSWNFTNWGPGQPSNNNDNENYLEMNTEEEGKWNDVPLSYEHDHGYICQYSQGRNYNLDCNFTKHFSFSLF